MGKRRITVIDDSELDTYVFKKLSDQLHFDVEFSFKNNSETYVSQLEEKLEELPSDIFLDLRMPVLNGFEFLERLNQIEGADQVKVHIFTSSNLDSDKERAFAFSQVKSYLVKPISPEDMIGAIEG